MYIVPQTRSEWYVTHHHNSELQTALDSKLSTLIIIIYYYSLLSWKVVNRYRFRFTCNTPFCNCNCCVASCNKSRTTLCFSQRCETSCLRVTSPLQLATQFCQNGPIRAHLSQDVGDLARPSSCLLLYALQVAKKVANV